MSHPIEARGLRKDYKAFTAVAGIDFDLRRGECLGLLGPNGAGKTTTIKMVTCFSPLSAGSISVLGMDVTRFPREVKSRIGICPQEDSIDPDFSVRQNLVVYARYFDLDPAAARARADELLAFVELSDKAESGVTELSGGMKRRLVLARALLHRPDLLILDEPTTGLDPSARHVVWRKIRQLKGQGVSVLLTSHYMEEVSQLCDRVILMEKGRIVLEGEPAALVAREVGREVVEIWGGGDETEAWLRARGLRYQKSDDRFYLPDAKGGEVAALVAEGLPRVARLVRPASLEDVFIQKTGQRLDA